ncbi:CCHC-type domain-containing protein [Abeliophyllum distichum]|uniref:CCHC-type domain-containing protein n=1 Tax=Abeliophyllum distichum TaxID=126358 RepID=A0ABD1SDG6_9LAMI
MKQDELIVDMITRFIDIINGLKGFDRKFTNGELMSKMLRSLSEDWNSLRMLIENLKDVNTYPLEELYGTLMTYELNNAEIKDKTRRSKEEMKEPPKRQIVLKSTNDEGSSNTNMSNEELDDLVLLAKKWRGFQNNRRFQKKDDKCEEKIKISYAMIVTNSVIRRPNARTKKSSPKRKVFKLHGTIVMKIISNKMKFKKKSSTWLLRMR